MRSRVEDAVAMFESGYNCAQAVFATYADVLGMERVTALQLSSPMGAGVGRMREVCGAVSGMAMLAGLKEGNTDPADEAGKAAIYELVQAMGNAFKQHTGSIICRDLLDIAELGQGVVPTVRTAEYYAKRPCSRMVAAASKIIEEQLLAEFD